VIRGGFALLCGVTIAVALTCAASAQSSVSLVGINAMQDGNAAVIELHTSGPADFVLDRFTMGHWLTVWSNKFEVGTDVKESPLDFGRSELADMVTGVSLANIKRSGAVKIYLGSAADPRKATLTQDGDITRVRIPLKAGAKSNTANYKSQFAVRAKEDTTATSEPEEAPAEAAKQTALDTAYVGSDLSNKSFRADSDGTGLLALSEKPKAEKTKYSNKSIAQLMDDSTRLVQANAKLPKAEKSGSNVKGDFYRPFEPAMQPVAANPMMPSAQGNAMPVSGKDALRGVRVTEYEILGQPLDQALTLLVAPTGWNVIVDSSVGKDLVSLSFKNSRVDLRSALDLLTRSYGLEYVVQDGTIVVGSKDKLYQTGLLGYSARLFILSYAEPRGVKQMLLQTGLLAEDQIEIYSERATAGGGAAAGGAGGGQAGGASGAGAGMDSGSGSGGSASGGSGGAAGAASQAGRTTAQTNVSTTPQNSVFVKAPPDYMEKIAAIIENLDRRPQLVEMEVRVCEANGTALKSLGIGTTGSTSTTFTEGGVGAQGFEAFSIGDFHRAAGQSFAFTLFHQVEEGNLKILAQPTLTTAEGKTADYFAGDRIPYISQPANNTGGASQAAQVDFIDLGVKLRFTPRIDADGMVTIDVSPEVSTLVGFIDLGSGATAPRSTERRLHTTVRVNNCEPFVLAGLINESESETISRIPVLADLPMVGKLFRHKTKDRTRTEIIIVVVPKIKD
jgi:type IV pilus assembly protein PilQ